MSESLLQVRDLCAGYGASRVLDGVSFSVGAEAVALIGRNGMGKTTLCDTIMGLVRATSGEIVFNGERIDNHAPEKIARSTFFGTAAVTIAITNAIEITAPVFWSIVRAPAAMPAPGWTAS